MCVRKASTIHSHEEINCVVLANRKIICTVQHPFVSEGALLAN